MEVGIIPLSNSRFKLAWRIFLFTLVAMQLVNSVSAGVVLSDDFNDNSLDTSIWTLDVVGSGNSFTEINQEACFVTYGHYGWNNGHALLWSKTQHIQNWDCITISGKWKFKDPGTAEMRLGVCDDSDPSKYVGIHYASWLDGFGARDNIRYYGGTSPVIEIRTIPLQYVTFKLVIYKDRFEYWENGVKIKSVPSEILSDSEYFVFKIGGWDYSSYYSHMYFDDIEVANDCTGTTTSTQIPEFPTIALPMLAVIGLMFIFGRNKRE